MKRGALYRVDSRLVDLPFWQPKHSGNRSADPADPAELAELAKLAGIIKAIAAHLQSFAAS
jgi:hypothetical protein